MDNVVNNNSWFIPIRVSSDSNLNLFFFHFSGGSASYFRKWENDLFKQVNIFALQMPGREGRFDEQFILSMDDLIPIVYDAFPKNLSSPSILFGHSLGALIAFELARVININTNTNVDLRRIIVSACQAPDIPLTRKLMHNLSYNDLLYEIKKYNGIPEELFEEKEFLFDVVLPILRADFTISDLYKYKPGAKIKSKITAIGGREDNTFEISNMLKWDKHTDNFDHKYFDGDHFFINSSYREVIDFINNIFIQELKKR